MKIDNLRMILRQALSDSEFIGKTWFAGGCVRDYLLNPQAELPSDIDITVELEAGGISLARYLANKLRGRMGKVHPEYGTASLEAMGLSWEFVATRKEKYPLHSRYPLVCFGDLSDDVQRRDFTINALLLPIHEGSVLDLSGWGLADLEQKLIRSLGEPAKKFQEDPLRMLRALRFALRFGFEIETDTLQAMITQAPQLKRISRKQTETELDKVLGTSSKEDWQRWLEKLGWEEYIRL